MTACQQAAQTPPSFKSLLQQLKRYAILLVTLFGRESPLLIVVVQMIKNLENYGDYARTTMTKQTIASIMWVLHSQSRHFSAGQMSNVTTPGSLRDDFMHMMMCIKTTQPVFNGDVPPHLYLPPLIQPANTPTTIPSNKCKRDDSIGGDRTSKNKIIKIQHYHPLIKQALKPVMDHHSKLPRIQTLCAAAGCDANMSSGILGSVHHVDMGDTGGTHSSHIETLVTA